MIICLSSAVCLILEGHFGCHCVPDNFNSGAMYEIKLCHANNIDNIGDDNGSGGGFGLSTPYQHDDDDNVHFFPPQEH